jgi:hypothetical protein
MLYKEQTENLEHGYPAAGARTLYESVLWIRIH